MEVPGGEKNKKMVCLYEALGTYFFVNCHKLGLWFRKWFNWLLIRSSCSYYFWMHYSFWTDLRGSFQSCCHNWCSYQRRIKQVFFEFGILNNDYIIINIWSDVGLWIKLLRLDIQRWVSKTRDSNIMPTQIK